MEVISLLEAENSRDSGYSQYFPDKWYYDGMCANYRKATTEFMYRLYLRKDSVSLETKKLLDEHREIMDEIDRFYRKYGELSEEKMAQHLITESEYLIGLYTTSED